jgi:tRNA threonylcarbamoyladenosine biosynthesis protein TsaB
MKILALDTTTRFLCLGLYDKDKACGLHLETGVKLSRVLALTVKRAIESLGWRFRDIDYFASGLGPGSFTGVRIGLAAIKGFAWALNRPVVGISTLDILAGNALTSIKSRSNAGFVAPIVDAKRNLVYTCIYKITRAGLQRITGYMLLGKNDFLLRIKKHCGKRANIIMLGDGLQVYGQDISRGIAGAVLLDKDYWYPRPENIIRLAQERIKKKDFSSPYKIKPIYLYPKECQIKLKVKTQKSKVNA